MYGNPPKKSKDPKLYPLDFYINFFDKKVRGKGGFYLKIEKKIKST